MSATLRIVAFAVVIGLAALVGDWIGTAVIRRLDREYRRGNRQVPPVPPAEAPRESPGYVLLVRPRNAVPSHRWEPDPGVLEMQAAESGDDPDLFVVRPTVGEERP